MGTPVEMPDIAYANNRLRLYFAEGGLWNPESADHVAVRTLLADVSEVLRYLNVVVDNAHARLNGAGMLGTSKTDLVAAAYEAFRQKETVSVTDHEKIRRVLGDAIVKATQLSDRDTAMQMKTLPYERLDSVALQGAIRLFDGEHLLVLRPFGWHLDGEHIPNAAEHFSRDGICQEHLWEVVCEFGPYVAIVRAFMGSVEGAARE